jgi:uncharacterized protein (UPF0303 family)
MEDILEKLLSEESELQFTRFNEETAWRVGSWLYKTAAAEGLPVTIDITLAGRRLFHAARPGTSPDNDAWIERKIRLVNRTGHSSFYEGRRLQGLGKTIETAMLLKESDYAPHGGCFPIILKSTGPVGTVTVSGLPQEEDHRLVVRALRHVLKKEKNV